MKHNRFAHMCYQSHNGKFAIGLLNKMSKNDINFPPTKQAEARAEFAERSVQKLQKEVDRLEGKSIRVRFEFFHALLNFFLHKTDNSTNK